MDTQNLSNLIARTRRVGPSIQRGGGGRTLHVPPIREPFNSPERYRETYQPIQSEWRKQFSNPREAAIALGIVEPPTLGSNPREIAGEAYLASRMAQKPSTANDGVQGWWNSEERAKWVPTSMVDNRIMQPPHVPQDPHVPNVQTRPERVAPVENLAYHEPWPGKWNRPSRRDWIKVGGYDAAPSIYGPGWDPNFVYDPAGTYGQQNLSYSRGGGTPLINYSTGGPLVPRAAGGPVPGGPMNQGPMAPVQGTLRQLPRPYGRPQMTPQMRDIFSNLVRPALQQQAGMIPRQQMSPFISPRPSELMGGNTISPYPGPISQGLAPSPTGDYLVGERGPEILQMAPGSMGNVVPLQGQRQGQLSSLINRPSPMRQMGMGPRPFGVNSKLTGRALGGPVPGIGAPSQPPGMPPGMPPGIPPGIAGQPPVSPPVPPGPPPGPPIGSSGDTSQRDAIIMSLLKEAMGGSTDIQTLTQMLEKLVNENEKGIGGLPSRPGQPPGIAGQPPGIAGQPPGIASKPPGMPSQPPMSNTPMPARPMPMAPKPPMPNSIIPGRAQGGPVSGPDGTNEVANLIRQLYL